MTTQTRDLIAAVLSLPLSDRAALAEVVVDSLPAERQSDVYQAWLTEIRERLTAFRRGEIEAIDEEKVYAELLNDDEP